MTDADRIEALLDLVDLDRPPAESRGPKLAVLGLAAPAPKGGYRPTTAGWSLLGERGRPFRSSTEQLGIVLNSGNLDGLNAQRLLMPDLSTDDAELDALWRQVFGQPLPMLGAPEIARKILDDHLPERRD